jgi:Tol biopolymer transport system component
MTESRDLLERELERLSPPRIPIDRLSRRRERRQRNRRLGSAVVGIVVALLAIGSLLRFVSQGDTTGNPSPSPSVERTAEPADLSFLDLSTGRTRPLPTSISTIPEAGSFEVSPDGQSLAFDARPASEEAHQIFVSDIDGSNVRQVTDDVRVHARNPSWSPDGTMLVYETRTFPIGVEDPFDDLFVLDLETGRDRRLSVDLGLDAIPYFDMHTPTFGPDGRTIVYTDFDPEGDSVDLRQVSVKGGRSTLLKRRAAFGAVSPDGRTIAYRTALMIPGLGTTVSLMSIDGTDQLPSPNVVPVMGSLLQVDRGTIPSWSPSGRWVAYADPASNIRPRRVFVFDRVTGRITKVGRGTEAAWLDDDTLIVRYYAPART